MDDNPLCPSMPAAGGFVEAQADGFDQRLIDPFRLHRQSVTLPGIDGIPFRGPTPDLKEDDPDRKRPQLGAKVGLRQLNLADPEDMEAYRRIAQMVGNGCAQISFEERMYDESIKSWRVLIRWMEHYYFIPPSARD